MPTLHQVVVRALARNPAQVEEAIYYIQFDFEAVLKALEDPNDQRLTDLRKAMLPWQLGYDVYCPLCYLGFKNLQGFSIHT